MYSARRYKTILYMRAAN